MANNIKAETMLHCFTFIAVLFVAVNAKINCGTSWWHHGGLCYTTSAAVVSSQMVSACLLLSHRAKPAAILTKRLDRALPDLPWVWLGLVVENNAKRWIDGSPVHYAPISSHYGRRDEGGVLRYGPGNWSYHNTNMRKLNRHSTLCVRTPSLLRPCPRGWSKADNDYCVHDPEVVDTWLGCNLRCREAHPNATLIITKTAGLLAWAKKNSAQHVLPMHLGLSDREEEGVWRWEDGTVNTARNLPANDRRNRPADSAVLLKNRIGSRNGHMHSMKSNCLCSMPSDVDPRTVTEPLALSCPLGWWLRGSKCLRAGAVTNSSLDAFYSCPKLHWAAHVANFDTRDMAVLRGAANRTEHWLRRSCSTCAKVTLQKDFPAGEQTPCSGGPPRPVLCALQACHAHCDLPARPFAGRCVQHIGKLMTRPAAVTACAALHLTARLASVRSQLENDFLVTMAVPDGLRRQAASTHWIGMQRAAGGQPWRWQDGTEWSVDRVDRPTGQDNTRWGFLEAFSQRWLPTATSATKRPALCQWDPCFVRASDDMIGYE